MEGMVSRDRRGGALRAIAVGVLAGTLGLVLAVGAAAATPSPTIHFVTPPPEPSGVGRAFVNWITVSPAYQHTGAVAAIGSPMSCSGNCTTLWVSRDGGSTWHKAASRNWSPTRVEIAVDATGHEVFYGLGKQLMRSTDLGESFQPAGGGGMPTFLPRYSKDGTVAVAGFGQGSDYEIQGGAAHQVAGSNNTMADLQFLVSPEFPSGGSWSPVLLAGMDPHTQSPVVLRCTADFACANPTTIVQAGVTPSSMTTMATLLYASTDYAEHGSVFADTPVGVAKSTDGGATFTPLSVVSAAGSDRTATPSMALAPGYREAGPVRTAYVSVLQAFDMQSKAAHTAGGVYITSDGGSSWQPLATTGPFAGGSQSVAVGPDGRLFAGFLDRTGSAGLLCSIDGGLSWQASCPPVGDHGDTGRAAGAANGCAGSCSGGATARPGAAGSSAAPDTGGPVKDTVNTAATTPAGSQRRPWVVVAIVVAAVSALGAVALRVRTALRRRSDSRPTAS